ncbi:MAG TPA: MMPL family transporter [Candidatus Baltobacteraceae bacterium]|nr:MMPL family transporter [Candidatus Baltobacteraceae bacterium]
MTSVADSFFARMLRALARMVCRYPAWFVLPQIVLFVVCVVYAVFCLKFDMSRDNLVGSDKKYHQVYMKYQQEFPGEDEFAVVVESQSMDLCRQYVERLAAKLEPETNLFTDIYYKGDMASLGEKALLFAPEEDLKEMESALQTYRPFIEQFTRATNLNSFFGLINRQFRTAKREENAENNALISAIPALQRIVEQASVSLSLPGVPVSPGVDALFGGGQEAQERMYLTFASNRIYLVTARARTSDLVPAAVKRMRQLIQETDMEVSGLNVGLTGEPVLDYDEMQQSQRDSTVASVVSLLLCSLIFIYAYRETGRPLKAVACLIVGLGYTMGFTTLVIGHLNILTITFAPILIGLAIDFAIHFITRYEEETRKRVPPTAAMEKAMVFTGQGIVTGALTTAAAFLAMGLTDFKGIQEMGIISGGGLALCLIPMLTMLPVLLMRGTQNAIDHALGAAAERRARIENFWLQRPALVIGLTLTLCVGAATQFHKVRFDYNLLHMQSKGLSSVEFENKLVFSGQSVLYAAIEADSLAQAQHFEEIVSNLPAVSSVDGNDKGDAIFDLFTRDQSAKIRMVRDIKKEISDIHFDPSDDNPVDLTALCTTLYSTMGYLALAADSVGKDREALAQQLRSLRGSIMDFRVKVLSGDPAIPERLRGYQEALFNDIRETFNAIKDQDTSGALKPQDLPPSLRTRFVGVSGKYRLLVFPKYDIWNHDVQREFITELRTALKGDADRVTGTPVQLYEYTTLLKNSYQQAALYALVAIALMVLFHFRSLVCVVLSLLPVAIGSAWTLGVMALSGIAFNPANIMTLPLVIGIGVTNGIHILNRVAEENNASILSKSTGKAVLVSGLTALAGFGSLTLGKHQGIRSLGLVMAIGIATCMVAGLTFLPALLKVLGSLGWTIGSKRPRSGNAAPPLGLEEPR